MVNIIKGKEPIYEVENYDVVLMGISTHNKLMGNFQGKMAVKYPFLEEIIDNTPYGDLRKLGKRITIDDKGTPVISLMFICKYPTRKENFIDYDALEKCLRTANAEFKGKKVIMTLAGSTRFDGRGDRKKCLNIIKKCTNDLKVDIFDYEQISIKEEISRQKKYFTNLKKKYKDNKEMQEKIKEMAREMRMKTFLPFYGENKEEDEILNF